MLYLALNGTYSDSITGLVISELPPVSKPAIRTQAEEIDGRDGDIITKLGYSAYDKTVRIGLMDADEIDNVISFFDSSGEVIFSNEPDKYYRYQILNQIDFAQLLEIRTADVVFHVQPFKYSATETDIEATYGGADPKTLSVTNSGNVEAKPKITITGSGTINLSLNSNQIFVIDMSGISTITIDAETMEATGGGVLRNRLVTGDYDAFVLQPGSNTVTWTGSITDIALTRYSRWI